MKTIKELINHLNEYKDAVIILGHSAIDELNIPKASPEDMQENLTRKSLRRNPEAFWKFYREYLYRDPDSTPLTTTQKNVKELCDLGLVSKVFVQSTDGLLTMAGVTQAVNLHGSVLTYTCQKSSCKITYPSNHVMTLEETVPTCEVCGSNLRPDITIVGETYDEDIFMDLKQSLIDSHTLILIDIDTKEEAILNLVADYSDIKVLDKTTMAQGVEATERMIVAIHEPSLELDFNEVAFCEFLVKDNCKSATNRLLKAIRGK
jgi:hypothetical protein